MALAFVPPEDATYPEWVTPTQIKYLEAVKEHGTARKAARALGLSDDTVAKSLRAYRREAARRGIAPGHFEHGTAPGFQMAKVTVQRGPDGEVERTWERQTPDDEKREALIQAAIQAACESIPRLKPRPAPAFTADALLTEYIFTDYHLGMRAWAEEGGADWNLEIAEDLLTRSFEYLISSAPPSRVGLIAQLGDFMHFDGLCPVTPTSRHVVDAAGHYTEVVRVAVRCLRRMVDMALLKHAEVVILAAEGNHDIASSVWMRELLKALYEGEPRVAIMDSGKPYYAYQHGFTMLAYHHGHGRKKEGLSHYFAAAFPVMWGATRYRYGASGHYHHEITVKEEPGMRWTQHSTLAPNDSHSARGGYVSQRKAVANTYSEKTGRVAVLEVTPDMVEDLRLAA